MSLQSVTSSISLGIQYGSFVGAKQFPFGFDLLPTLQLWLSFSFFFLPSRFFSYKIYPHQFPLLPLLPFPSTLFSSLNPLSLHLPPEKQESKRQQPNTTNKIQESNAKALTLWLDTVIKQEEKSRRADRVRDPPSPTVTVPGHIWAHKALAEIGSAALLWFSVSFLLLIVSLKTTLLSMKLSLAHTNLLLLWFLWHFQFTLFTLYLFFYKKRLLVIIRHLLGIYGGLNEKCPQG